MSKEHTPGTLKGPTRLLFLVNAVHITAANFLMTSTECHAISQTTNTRLAISIYKMA
jgi:hypothetical protein